MKSIALSLLTVAAMLGSVVTASADSGVPKTYPLTKCPVSDEKLGEHGKPVKVTHDGTDVWLSLVDRQFHPSGRRDGEQAAD